MTMLRYAVLQVGDIWQIVCERRRIGRFATREEASRAGAALAREAVVSGHDIEFLVQDRFGRLQSGEFPSQTSD